MVAPKNAMDMVAPKNDMVAPIELILTFSVKKQVLYRCYHSTSVLTV